MRHETYATILGAVGHMLDLADARSFAVREGEQGLQVELVDGRGVRQLIDLSVADVAELLDWAQRVYTAPVTTTRDEGALRHFLEQRSAVSVG